MNKHFKKISYILCIAIFILGIQSYFYISARAKEGGITFTSPTVDNPLSDVTKISAKTIGTPQKVKFILKTKKKSAIKEANAYFEMSNKEWVYYLNSMEFSDNNYTLEAYAYYKNNIYTNTLDIIINNTEEKYTPKNNLKEPVALKKQNHKTTSSSNPLLAKIIPLLKEKINIAPELPDNDLKIAAINEPKEKNKTEENKEEVKKENTDTNIPENIVAVQDTTASSSQNLELNKNKAEEIIGGVMKALSSVYDTINKELFPIHKDLELEPQGKIAGAQITNEKQEKTDKPDNWFQYNLTITDVENNETIKNKKEITVKCNNPLDSVDFILNNPSTPKIDYTFSATNKFGYYTYWDYTLNTQDIKKGQYFLYAKGSIDWTTYESPMIIVNIK